MIKSLASLVCIGKHDAHKIVHAQLMQHGNDTRQKDFNTQAPARSLQKDDLWAIHASRRLTCHHYDHHFSSGIQVHGDSKHRVQSMNQSFVAAFNATTSYKPIVNPFRLTRLYNHIQSGLILPPDCLLSHMLACISIIMIMISTTIILTKSVQYRLSR